MSYWVYIIENRYKSVQAIVDAHCHQASMETCVFLCPYWLFFCARVCFALQGCSRIRKERSSTGFNDHLDYQLVQLKLRRAEDRPIVTELLSIRPLRPCQVYLCTMEIKRGWRANRRKWERSSSVHLSLPLILPFSLIFFISLVFFLCVWCNKKPVPLPGQSLDLRDLSEQWKSRMKKKRQTLTMNKQAWNKKKGNSKLFKKCTPALWWDFYIYHT